MTELQAGQVTVADLYRELVGMRADLSTVLTRQERIDVRNETADRVDGDHENRLRSLESFRWKLTGIALAVSTAAGAASGLIGYGLGHK